MSEEIKNNVELNEEELDAVAGGLNVQAMASASACAMASASASVAKAGVNLTSASALFKAEA